MIKASVILMALIITVAGCATNVSPKPIPKQHVVDPYEQGLVSAAKDIGDALRVLAETKNADTLMTIDPRKREQVIWQSNYTPEGMDIPVSIDWVGPVDPVIKLIAEVSHYKYRIIGKKPVPDYFIRVKHDKTPAIDVLRDAGTQVGPVAEVAIFPSTKLIELRYFRDTADKQIH